MNVFYEETGTFKVGAILADNDTSLQIEAAHGKRSKIKAVSVLLRFDIPPLSEFMRHAQTMMEELDTDFLWECCNDDNEFAGSTLAAEYFGHTPTPVEAAAILMRLHSSPIYFYKKGKGRYKAAPPDALKAALASQEKKRLQAEQQAQYVSQLNAFNLPKEFESQLSDLLYSPDKNTIEWKALEEASNTKKISTTQLLDKCGAIASSDQYHINQFLWANFPQGIEFGELDLENLINHPNELPTATVTAFSIDDATTTEIDDAFSITPLNLGSFRIGIHIAAPALGITSESTLDKIAAQRLSTIYMPGDKITMLPQAVINHYTLLENKVCPSLSLYLDVSDDYTVTATESRIENIKIADNLRHNTLEPYFNDKTLETAGEIDHQYGKELKLLWEFSCKMEQQRGKNNDLNNDRIEYHFEINDGIVTISERRRGSPIDKVVSELMIYANTEWGKQLADAGITGVYRSQGDGKVKMSTSPAPHQGLGVSQYAWSSSPLRRYIDFINQRQLIALILDETPAYEKDSENLLISMRDFDSAYSLYNDFQRTMERYWCLRWIQQEKLETINAQVIRDNLVKLDHLPMVIRVPSLPDLPIETDIQLKITYIDLLELTLGTKFLQKIDV